MNFCLSVVTLVLTLHISAHCNSQYELICNSRQTQLMSVKSILMMLPVEMSKCICCKQHSLTDAVIKLVDI